MPFLAKPFYIADKLGVAGETDVAARKPRAEYTRGLTIVGEAWDYMGNLTEVVYSISFVY